MTKSQNLEKYKPHRQGVERQPKDTLLINIWMRMFDLYGNQWESQMGHVGEDTFLTWQTGLTNMSEDQIKGGLTALISEGNDFPPNLIKFLRLCRGSIHPSHMAFVPELTRQPRKSVMRIEQAKQRALTGEPFKHVASDRHVDDWTREDELELRRLIIEWEVTRQDVEDELLSLNAMINGYEFSSGSLQSHLET